ncbi:MAG: cell division protein FtsZ [Candidatus Doudnabacteria bacterium RIFCSPHIGHO2_02_FULL_46_11]|uniref:Cell division protein FtsZ n=1 Tax=Candidatus Doudnabacteria bacterium RIFCSPHIGHO2_02_FULL_46_11 TaxID=1817832 RepID=A0A1F5P7I1_9BACT|nr:MAG: cell division protein FtsZ [Candidatus Doudnabacteria bacterium RIFCSPHIGHO2_02_FULL_46_11]
MPEVKPKIENFARIKVIGVGGGGGNAINRMAEVGISGVDFITINTDAQALHSVKTDKRIQIGKDTTRGLGAGMNPDTGKQAAEETQDEIYETVKNADMVFVTGGLGGGTGTGAMPVVGEIARESGVLTVGVVTKPFAFEGAKRREIADKGLDQLRNKVDAIIVVPNDRILQIIDRKTSLIDAFKTVDDVLRQGVQGISDLITINGMINVDFADVKAIMQNSGTALMGIGRGSGENRAIEAAKMAIDSPLLELSIDGATGVLFNITGGKDLGMHEVDEAGKIITKSVHPDAKIIFGAVVDEALQDEVRITVVATGFDDNALRTPAMRASLSASAAVFESPYRPVMEAGSSKKAEKSELIQPIMVPSSSANSQAEETNENGIGESEELEIPAFIRRKMK